MGGEWGGSGGGEEKVGRVRVENLGDDLLEINSHQIHMSQQIYVVE